MNCNTFNKENWFGFQVVPCCHCSNWYHSAPRKNKCIIAFWKVNFPKSNMRDFILNIFTIEDAIPRLRAAMHLYHPEYLELLNKFLLLK